jgi:hypothetical protein
MRNKRKCVNDWKIVIVILLMLLLVFMCCGCTSNNRNISINEGLNYAVPFSLKTKPEDILDTKIEGTVFVFGEKSETQHACFVATFHIDPEDRMGILVDFQHGTHVTSINWDYRSQEPHTWDRKYSWIGRSAELDAEFTTIQIGFAYDEEPPSGGGNGSLIVDFDFNIDEDATVDETPISMTIGSAKSEPQSFSEYLFLDIGDPNAS